MAIRKGCVQWESLTEFAFIRIRNQGLRDQKDPHRSDVTEATCFLSTSDPQNFMGIFTPLPVKMN